MNRFSYTFAVLCLLLAFILKSCHGSGSFGFDIHHRFSDPVKAMLNIDDNELPEERTVDFYNAIIHRDRIFHGRRLAGNGAKQLPSLTFLDGNVTARFSFLGFLYYANVSVGTPPSWFLVALDTGSERFWLPCDCSPNCVNSLELSPTQALELNIYSLTDSSTGTQLSCMSPSCGNGVNCSPSSSNCPYSISYLSSDTSSSGYLVEDVLHLTADADPYAYIDTRITFGCGVMQTGSFLKTAAPNGLLGLSMDDMSVPSLLASKNIVADSFSMCFTKEGIGRISFGDTGSIGQSETPINLDRFNLYNVSITQVSSGSNVSAADFTAIFDTGTSFTILAEPAYSILTRMFDSQVTGKRVQLDSRSPFEYCYTVSSSLKELRIPVINLTMSGGHQFIVKQPTVTISFPDGSSIFCLGVVKAEAQNVGISKEVNIIGENFMSGYRLVFNREKMVLGWKTSDCNEAVTPGTGYDLPKSAMPSASSSRHCYLLLAVTTLLVQILVTRIHINFRNIF